MTRTGKIARLPRKIRDQLNRRLAANENGRSLLSWLNDSPAVKAILAAEFAGQPINKQNLGAWRSGGFAEWQARQQMLEASRELAGHANDLNHATSGLISEYLGTALAAHYALALSRWQDPADAAFRQNIRVLHSVCRDIAEVRRGYHSAARLQLGVDRLQRQQEKTEEDVAAHFEQWLQLPGMRDLICQNWASPDERRRVLREILGLPPEPKAAESNP